LELTDVAALIDRIGERVMVAFCRCLVHVDRLNSLLDFVQMSIDVHGEH